MTVNQWYELGDGGYKFVAAVTPEKMEKLTRLCALKGCSCKPIDAPPREWLLKEHFNAGIAVEEAKAYLSEIYSLLTRD